MKRLLTILVLLLTLCASAHAEPSPQEQFNRFTQQAQQRIKDRKYDQAEKDLLEALALAPNHHATLITMTRVQAKLGRPDHAIIYFERACEAGYAEFDPIEKDPDLAEVRRQPRYRQLLANKENYLKRGADRELETCRKAFGDAYRYELDHQNKLIFVADTDAQTLADIRKWLAAQTRSLRQQLFDRGADYYVGIVLPSPTDFPRVARNLGLPANAEGVYLPEQKVLVARRLGQVMTHEFTHALYAGDTGPIAQKHAVWVTEGIASLYEPAQFEGEVLVPRDTVRLVWLQNAYRGKRLIPLERLLVMTQANFVANPNMSYGQASSIMLHLHERGLLRDFYRAYRDGFDKDPTGKAALEKVTRLKLADFEKQWQEWMKDRTPPVMDSGPSGAFMGVRFAQQNDGLRVEQVVANTPAEKAGLKMGDLIVGLNDHDIRDPYSLLPTLAEFKPGQSIILRIRRGSEYLKIPLTLGRRDGKPVAPRP